LKSKPHQDLKPCDELGHILVHYHLLLTGYQWVMNVFSIYQNNLWKPETSQYGVAGSRICCSRPVMLV